MDTGSLKDKNTVFYHIYPLDSEACLEKLHCACLQIVGQYIDVVWNAEGFTLSLAESQAVPHLYGQLWFDNSVQDEWYVVWLLQKISKELPVAVKVYDDDGDFVLIEAANVLPSWLNPDNSSNRLFLYSGEFVLIPQPASPAEVALFPQNGVTLTQALKCVGKVDKAKGRKLNAIVQAKISAFPSRDLHRVRCHLPMGLLHALSSTPSLISTLISLYLYSDTREKQEVIKCKRLEWSGAHECNVNLTRCQYAQLYSQRITTTSSWDHVPVGHVDHQSKQLGLKITVGAELALSIAEGETASDAEFTKYLKRLHSFGYFDGNLEGSNAYNSLLQKAELFFRSSQGQNSGSSWLGTCRSLKNIVSEPFDESTYMNTAVQESDSDAWMDVIPDDIQRWFLKGRQSDKMESDGKVSKSSAPAEEVASEQLAGLNSQLKGFIDNISSHEGAEVPAPQIDFNVDDFINCIKDFKNQIDEAANKGSESEDTSSLDSGSIRTESDEEMQEYMKDLEEQLQSTTIGDTFEKQDGGELDIDFNLVSNILQSFSAESGLSGPASSVLASLGVHLPRDDDPNDGS